MDFMKQFFVLLVTMLIVDGGLASSSSLMFNFTVAKDGTGNSFTISDAIAAAPEKSTSRYYIRVKPGIYDEYVVVPKNKPFISLIGDNAATTIITGSHSNTTGFRTSESATMAVHGDGFLGKFLTIRNSAGPGGGQAVALQNEANQSAFYWCSLVGFQDTLCVKESSQFYKNCDIYGTVDYIFGTGPAVFQDCRLFSRMPNHTLTVTAQQMKSPDDGSGFVFQNCIVSVPPKLRLQKSSVTTYLGRPWADYSTVVFMQSFLDSIVVPSGWLEWPPHRLDLLFFAEYNNSGPGASIDGRVKWPGYHGTIDVAEASKYTVSNFISGDSWISALGVPYYGGLIVPPHP